MKRPYFFEVFIAANFILIVALLWRVTHNPLTTLLTMFAVLLPVFVLQLLLGVAIRFAIQRGRYTPSIRSRTWIVDSVRLVFFSVLSVHTYGWIKLAVPLLHPALYDQELWNIDAALFGGHSPNVFFVTLFGASLRFFDWTYANIFLASIWIASTYFLSDPDDRIRVRFMNSNALLWIAGSWLYMLVPSLGPAYRFPQVWLPLSSMLGNTQNLQRILMTNYQNVLHHGPVNVFFGIGAFPSLHVAFEVLVFLWMRRLWRAGAVLFAVFSILIFFGSVVTGWHYLIDAIAGVALAFAAYAAVAIRRRSQTFSAANASAH